MKKNIIKLSIKDIENIVKRTINESKLTEDDMMNVNEPESEDTFSDKNVMIGKGPDGKIYVYDVTNNTILGTK
jgi:hypothetical protein